MSRSSRTRRPSPPRPEAGSDAARPPFWERVRPAPVALALAGAHLLLVLAIVASTPYDGGDNAAYLALARSILEDGSYRDLWDPAAAAHTQYPPGWPLLLAAALSAGIRPWLGLKVLSALFSAAAVALAYLWARRASSAGVALVAGVVLAVAPGLAALARQELSDTPFWAFCMLAVWGLARLGSPDAPGDGGSGGAGARRGASVAAVGGVFLAYVTRSAGLPLALAAGLWLAWRRRWGTLAAMTAATGAFALLWWMRARALGGGGYGDYLRYVDPYRPELGTVDAAALARRVWTNVVDYTADHLPALLSGTRGGSAMLVLGIVVFALAAAGWARRLRDAERDATVVWLPLYLGLVLVWPAEWSGERFLLPVFPVLLVWACEAAAAAVRGGRAARALGVAAVGVMLVLSLPRLGGEALRMARCRATAGPLEPYPCMRPPVADYLGLARSMRGALPPGSAVIARKPTLWWAESGYPSRVYPYTGDPDALLRAARETGARYLVIDYFDNVSAIHLIPAMVQRPQAFCVMRSLGRERTTLMGILPGADTLPNLRDRPGDEMVEVGFSVCGPEYWAPGAASARE